MSSSKYSSTSPRLNPNYKKQSSPCKKISGGLETIYEGSGIAPQDHPLKSACYLEGRRCVNCGSEHVLVIYASQQFHGIGDGEYRDVEVLCQDCGRFSVYGYSDDGDDD